MIRSSTWLAGLLPTSDDAAASWGPVVNLESYLPEFREIDYMWPGETRIRSIWKPVPVLYPDLFRDILRYPYVWGIPL